MGLTGETQWTDAARKLLKGKRVVDVRYLSKDEAQQLGWHGRSLVIKFDNGLLLWASQDDEGNGPGALFTTDEEVHCLPVFPL